MEVLLRRGRKELRTSQLRLSERRNLSWEKIWTECDDALCNSCQTSPLKHTIVPYLTIGAVLSLVLVSFINFIPL